MPEVQPINPTNLSPKIFKQLASIGDRFLAYLLDAIIWIAPFLFFLLALFTLMESFTLNWIFLIILVIILILIIVLNIILVLKRSQSIGKYLMNIYVYDLETNKRMGFWKYALLRKLVTKEIIPAVPFFGFFYTVVDIIFIFRDDHRAVHDHMSNSVVLKLDKTKQRKKIFDFTVLE